MTLGEVETNLIEDLGVVFLKADDDLFLIGDGEDLDGDFLNLLSLAF